eukprot:7574763-Pyramimonas_sp.AAC.1
MQWSVILSGDVEEDDVVWARAVAALAEKGDCKVLAELVGKAVTIWVPSDHNALTLLLANF